MYHSNPFYSAYSRTRGKMKCQGHKSECLWEYAGGAREAQKVRDFMGTVKSEKKGR